MIQRCLVGLFTLLSTAAITPVFAQITLTGQVYDASTDEPLVGATIFIVNSRLGAVSDENGAFNISNIEQRGGILRVVMIGYKESAVPFLAKNNLVNINIRLTPNQSALGTVEITGKAEGQIKALLDQKQAESIKNIVSAEQIATFPDMNAAEVMQRIPGITLQRDQGEGRFVQLRGTPPELTNFNINGEQVPSPEGGVRYVGMDIIPSDQIDIIEVSKVMTPDMDADGIGGSVNIKTKDAADAIPDVRFTAAAGYNHLRKTPNYQMQYAYGQKFGGFGFHVNGSYFQNQQGSDNIEYDFAKGPFFGNQQAGQNNYSVQMREVQLRHYNITRTRLSVAPTLSYHFSPKSSIFLRAMYNRFSDNEVRRRKIYELDDALSFDYYLYGGIVHDVRARQKIQELSTVSLGGEHTLGKISIDYQCFGALASEHEPDRIEAAFESPGQAIAIRFNFENPDYPIAEFPNASNAVNATRYDAFELNEMLLEQRKVTDYNLTPRFNVRIPYTLNKQHGGYLKFGGKIRAKNKSRDIQSQQYAAYFKTPLGYPGQGPDLSLQTINGGFREDNLLHRGYLLEYMPDAQQLRDFYEFYPQHFVYDRNATKTQSFGEDYEARERIYAGYAMFRHDFRQLMVLGGIRYEQTNIDYRGARIVLDGNKFKSIDTLTDQRTHAFWLPQLQLKYALTPQMNLRAAVTYTYSRPNFDDVLPYREQDREEVKFGNPDLRYPRSTNVDLLAERYFSTGLLSGGVFYKHIDDFIFFFKRFAHEGDPSDFGLVEITKAANGESASVYGAELQWQAKFKTLPGIWKNFGVYTNYTFTHADARIGKRQPANFTDAVVVFGNDDLSILANATEKEWVTLPGQARHTGNFSLFYDNRKLFIRLTANYHDAFLFRFGADADLDEYYDEEFRLDLTANFDINRKTNLFFDAINLTNTPLRYYLGNKNRIKQLEYYSWWCRAGVKFNF